MTLLTASAVFAQGYKPVGRPTLFDRIIARLLGGVTFTTAPCTSGDKRCSATNNRYADLCENGQWTLNLPYCAEGYGCTDSLAKCQEYLIDNPPCCILGLYCVVGTSRCDPMDETKIQDCTGNAWIYADQCPSGQYCVDVNLGDGITSCEEYSITTTMPVVCNVDSDCANICSGHEGWWINCDKSVEPKGYCSYSSIHNTGFDYQCPTTGTPTTTIRPESCGIGKEFKDNRCCWSDGFRVMECASSHYLCTACPTCCSGYCEHDAVFGGWICKQQTKVQSGCQIDSDCCYNYNTTPYTSGWWANCIIENNQGYCMYNTLHATGYDYHCPGEMQAYTPDGQLVPVDCVMYTKLECFAHADKCVWNGDQYGCTNKGTGTGGTGSNQSYPGGECEMDSDCPVGYICKRALLSPWKTCQTASGWDTFFKGLEKLGEVVCIPGTEFCFAIFVWIIFAIIILYILSFLK